jgi:hypothetical protein
VSIALVFVFVCYLLLLTPHHSHSPTLLAATSTTRESGERDNKQLTLKQQGRQIADRGTMPAMPMNYALCLTKFN